MKKIPIQFDYKGKHYKGHFSEVSGGGANTWHLMIENYYIGQLILTETYGHACANSSVHLPINMNFSNFIQWQLRACDF